MTDPNDGMQQFWDDLLGGEPWVSKANQNSASDEPPQFAKPVVNASWPACCPVCRGTDRLTTLNLETGGTINDACFACDGTGKVMMQQERRAA